MPRVTPLFAGLMLIVTSATSIPFYVQEQCSCQPTSVEGIVNASAFTECQREAARLQTNRAALRSMAQMPKTWIDDTDTMNLALQPDHDRYADEKRPSHVLSLPAARVTASSPSCRPSSWSWSKLRNYGGDAQTRNTGENVGTRHSGRPYERHVKYEGFNVVCEGRMYTARTSEIIYVDLKPLSVLCIFFSVVFACTTIIDWALNSWANYPTRIRLDGSEKVLYALPQEHDQSQTPTQASDEDPTIEEQVGIVNSCQEAKCDSQQ
ncbi:uncharacterized protein PV09_01791 [Verruconis gallopava]|uniref:Uncharacterized protein n=1 Tax=Verruconis gallopava TaxID=253628 RepID=A0A0D2AM99_9PEZI|nr:uncharacterized protein PV09_01791 [Verruconis gallopava]KIW07878.1 hypothetical protein PV09_01791 [Verruconis gallopava]